MKRLILSVAASAIGMVCAYSASAQEVVPPEGYEFADSLVYRRADVADTTLLGRDILDIMPSRAKGDKAQVSVNQSDAIVSSLHEYVSANASREIVGYRVRIFFDNHRTARAESEAALKKFNGIYHDVLWRDVFQIDAVNLPRHLFIIRHPRRCNKVREFE